MVTVAATHTLSGPVMEPAAGSGLMVITVVVGVRPQNELIVYVTIAVPASAPFTLPRGVIVAVPPPLILHVPPSVALLSVTDAPTHTLEGPVIDPAEGVVATVTVCIADAAAQGAVLTV